MAVFILAKFPILVKCKWHATTCGIILWLIFWLHVFFIFAMVRVQYIRDNVIYLRNNHCNRFSHYCASLTEEIKKKEEVQINGLVISQLGTLAMHSGVLFSLTSSENARE